MAVAQLVEHVGADKKQLLAGHLGPDAAAVFIMYGVPVYALFPEETVVFVEYGPQGLEIAPRVIGILLDLVA